MVQIQKNISYPYRSCETSLKDAKEIGVKSIALIGEGENTLPDFYEIINYGREIDLDLGLATNGIRIDHKKLDIILDSLKWMNSILARTKETFQKIHDKSNGWVGYAKALAEMKKLNSNCVIGFQMVVTKENMNDIFHYQNLVGNVVLIILL